MVQELLSLDDVEDEGFEYFEPANSNTRKHPELFEVSQVLSVLLNRIADYKHKPGLRLRSSLSLLLFVRTSKCLLND